MNWKKVAITALFCGVVSPAPGAPDVTGVPGGVQSNDWVWTIDITPDLTLNPDNAGTPVYVELGFRLTGAPLLSATIASPSEFDTPVPGKKIFGWETPVPFNSNFAEGLQVNTSAGEIFAAYASGNFTIPGPKHFLTVTASGPSNGGPSLSSTIEWLGVYGIGDNKGRITQVTGLVGSTYITSNFDIFAGSATQAVPEPACGALAVICAAISMLRLQRRPSARARHG